MFTFKKEMYNFQSEASWLFFLILVLGDAIFLMKGFRVIEEIKSQVAQGFDVLLRMEKSLKWVVCILLLLAIFTMILIVIPPAGAASVI